MPNPTPPFLPLELSVLERKIIQEILEIRDNLKYALSSPLHWVGVLRRSTLARAIRAASKATR